MPTYDYLCKSCGHELEVFQSMTARRLRRCPKCGKAALERQLGAGAGVLFKGSGFYKTDYCSGSACSKPSGKAEPSQDKKAPPKKAED